MNRTPLKTRLGKRLQELFHTIPGDLSHCYDLCCDHGALGCATLEKQPACQVIFNDIHSGITQELDLKLTSYKASGYQIETKPAEDIKLRKATKGAVILAGVGDEQCIKILTSLLAQPNSREYTFIISPATKVFFVRRFLNTQRIQLVSETTVTENKRTYEILVFIPAEYPSEETGIDPFGHCWSTGNSDHHKHITKLIKFFSAQQNPDQNGDSDSISHGYEKILKKIKINS